MNKDVLPFNPTENCSSGGLYFTNEANLSIFLEYGPNIREIFINNNENVCVQNYKFKTHKFTLGSKLTKKDLEKFKNFLEL